MSHPPSASEPVVDSGETEADLIAVAEQVDESDQDDNDSALGSDAVSSTASIGSSIMKYREENGRTYHAYKDGTYVLPNDEPENQRLDLQHHLFLLTLHGKLFTCAPANTKFNQVLDVGCGTGIWAIDFADEHPEANVIGVDLSPIQPYFIPPNCTFFVDDIEDEWTWSTPFDLIHARMMTGGIVDWEKFIKQSFEHLSPGGRIELSDIVFPVLCIDDSMPEDSALRKWSGYMLEASKKLNRPLDSAKDGKRLLRERGFTEIKEERFIWPMNRWPKDKHLKTLGSWVLEDICNGIQGLSLRLFTYGLGWTLPQVEVFLVDVRKEMRNPKIHAYWHM
ncbi:S-adenosyl-L-methionine-dependent methyltransferase [Xylogone sp. PMI_703]|nr:S-adenosyl-L-methionine-dependent methyltransferase [Xylogone sp. PMI_703]